MPDDFDIHERHRDDSDAGPADMSPFPVLQAGGFGATVDAYAWEPDADTSPPRMRLWLVSLPGSQQAVKALWAQLVKAEMATLTIDDGRAHFCSLASQTSRGWRFFKAPLPAAGGYHGVLVPEVALFSAERPKFLLLRRSADDPATLHYRFLSRRVTLPLHPTWAEWLWARALQTGEARRLKSWGLEAYLCTPDETELTADLTAAIRHGALGLADDCGQSVGARPSTPSVAVS